jgi:hypothetical protein
VRRVRRPKDTIASESGVTTEALVAAVAFVQSCGSLSVAQDQVATLERIASLT